MRIKLKAGLTVLLFLMFLMPSSAMSFGTPAMGQTLTVSGLPPGATVQFILNGGVPVFAVADSSGNVEYMPLLEGSLSIIAMQGGAVIDSATATVQAPPPSGQVRISDGSGSGASTGGGGVVTSENQSNVRKILRVDGSFRANVEVLFDFRRDPEFSVYLLLVTGRENEPDVTMLLQLLKGTSSQVTSPPPGKVYKNVNIVSSSRRIQEARVRFAVDNNWIAGSGGESGDIKLLKWEGGRWTELETFEISKDADSTFYEAKTTGFSPFAMSNTKVEAVPPATPLVTPTSVGTPGTPAATPSEKVPAAPVNWVLIIGVFLLIAIVVIVLYLGRNRFK